MILNQKLYETIRWIVAVVLPALIVLIDTVIPLWTADFPTEAVTTSLSAVDLFLGAIFGIAKISYDKSEATKVAKKQALFEKASVHDI